MEAALFQRLVDTRYDPLYRFALSLARNGDDALDLTQQTFARWAEKGHADPRYGKSGNWTLAMWQDKDRSYVLGMPAGPGSKDAVAALFRAWPAYFIVSVTAMVIASLRSQCHQASQDMRAKLARMPWSRAGHCEPRIPASRDSPLRELSVKHPG